MMPDLLEPIQAWESRVAQSASEYLALLQPVLQSLGLRVKTMLCRSQPSSAAHYKSTLDVQIVDEAERVLWADSLILYHDSEQWADTEAVVPFLQEAIREAVHTWRTQHEK
jgi:hypothetical protein